MVIKKLKSFIIYLQNRTEYKIKLTHSKSKQFVLDIKNDWPFLMDRYESAGTINPHYFLQDIWMAKRVIESGKNDHFDIGSRVDGFVSHLLSSNISVNLVDIRKLDIDYSGLNFILGNALDLSVFKSETIDSLSSLHAVEHFGLGRYGDQIDPDGWAKALHEYSRVLSQKGRLYLSVPIGSEDFLCFNGCRVFKPTTVINEMKELKLIEFAYINNLRIIENTEADAFDLKGNKPTTCGLFIFEK